MRIRTIKPEFYRSDDINTLSRENRLLFIGLWSYVDDNGVGIDDYRQITADLFALEDDQNEARQFVRDGLATLSRGLLIDRYEVDGKRYLHITTWDDHQRIDRPGKTRYPLPPAAYTPPTSEDVPVPEPVAAPSRESRESLAPGTEEQRNRGTEEQGKKDTRAARVSVLTQTEQTSFEEFYKAYPRHVSRREAEREFKAAIKRGVDPQHIAEAAGRYAVLTRDSEARWIKHPNKWLKDGCYDDEPDRRPAPIPQQAQSRAAAWQALKRPAAPAPDYIDAELIPLRSLR